MKRLFLIVICIFMLLGCNNAETMDEALTLRSAIEQANECAFSVIITADYGDKTYQFSMDCIADKKENVKFTVSKPETIAGIQGRITADGGDLIFDDQFLSIPLLTDDQLTPVSAPWILMRTLRGGYITSSTDGRITLEDTYDNVSLTVDISLDGNNLPKLAEIYWKNRRILTLEIVSFVLS